LSSFNLFKFGKIRKKAEQKREQRREQSREKKRKRQKRKRASPLLNAEKPRRRKLEKRNGKLGICKNSFYQLIYND